MKMPCLLLFMPLLILVSACKPPAEKGRHDNTVYTCSMHPQIRQNKPGNCPICGMTLVQVTQLKQETSSIHNATQAEATVQLSSAQNSIGSIRTEKAVRRIISRPLQLFGDIKYIADNHLDLTSFYPGRVEHVYISYNTNEVRKGDPLLDLYSEEAIGDQEKYLQALRDRYLTTFYERKIATAQIETIRTRLLKAGLTEDDLESLVKKGTVKRTITVRAASSGSIVGTIPHTGERMTQEEVLFHIAPLQKVWFAARVFEQDLSFLKTGQEAEIRSKANPAAVYPGKLVFIDRILDPATRTVLARFEVENSRRELLPEMSATATVDVSQGNGEPVLVIPQSAVIDTGKRKLVYVEISEGKYEQRDVVVGVYGSPSESKEDLLEIKSGIQEGDSIVVSGAFLIDAEAQLRGMEQTLHRH